MRGHLGFQRAQVPAQGGQVGLPGRAAELDLLHRSLQAPPLRASAIGPHLQPRRLLFRRLYLLQFGKQWSCDPC